MLDKVSTKSIVMFFKISLFPNVIMKLLAEATIIVACAFVLKHKLVRRGSVLSEHKRGSIMISAFEDQLSLADAGL